MSNIIRPKHYNCNPSGVECIDIIQHMNFCCGSAIKYIWRADLKNNAIEDLEKAKYLLDIEIKRRSNEARSKEEGARETNPDEHIECDKSVGTEGSNSETNNKKGSLPTSEHKLQHDQAWQDYFGTQGPYSFHSKKKGS